MLIHCMGNCYIASKQSWNVAHSELISATRLEKTALRGKLKSSPLGFIIFSVLLCISFHIDLLGQFAKVTFESKTCLAELQQAC